MTWICAHCDRLVDGVVCDCGRAYDPRVTTIRIPFAEGRALITIDARPLDRVMKRAQHIVGRRFGGEG
jgi:hypothetical protein